MQQKWKYFEEAYKRELKKTISIYSSGYNLKKYYIDYSFWVSFISKINAMPTQGWKIHISLLPKDCLKPFKRLIPYLVKENISFKLPFRAKSFILLNNGEGGESQIGKIITIYPKDERQLKVIVDSIKNKINFTSGPIIPSDIRYRSNSPIFFRYGVISARNYKLSEHGHKIFLISDPDNNIVIDTKNNDGSQVFWASKLPFKTCFSKDYYYQDPEKIVNNFIPIKILHKSPKGDVTQGLHYQKGYTIIQKRSFKGVSSDFYGNDACSKLKNEYIILKKLHKKIKCPKPILYKEYQNYSVLYLEELDGDNIYNLSREQILPLFSDIGILINKLHKYGFVHNDIKLPNFILAENEVFLIDFELSEAIGTLQKISGGTTGYFKYTHEYLVSNDNDRYAFAICIINVLLGVENSRLGLNTKKLTNLLKLYGFRNAIALINVLTKRGKKTAGLNDVQHLLPNIGESIGKTIEKIDDLFLWYQKIIPSSVNFIDDSIIKINGTSGFWNSKHSTAPSLSPKGINTGTAGIILGLMSIDTATGNNNTRTSLLLAINFLTNDNPLENCSGLFSGNAGIALSLIIGGKRFKLEKSVEKGISLLVNMEIGDISVDFFDGVAGILYSITTAYQITRDKRLLNKGELCCNKIITAAQTIRNVIVWPDSNMALTGAAHGSAGIAMVLLNYSRTINNSKIKSFAIKTLKSIYINRHISNKSIHHDLLSDIEDDIAPTLTWCHGVEGYLWCLIFNEEFIPYFTEEIEWCVNILKDASIINNPSLCHGLAGQLELWKMLSKIKEYKKISNSQIVEILHVLKIMHVKKKRAIIWTADEPTVISPDLWVGFLGVLSSASHLMSGNTSSFLSEKWLKKCSYNSLAKKKRYT
jgi:serine/threonine protein kinase